MEPFTHIKCSVEQYRQLAFLEGSAPTHTTVCKRIACGILPGCKEGVYYIYLNRETGQPEWPPHCKPEFVDREPEVADPAVLATVSPVNKVAAAAIEQILQGVTDG